MAVANDHPVAQWTQCIECFDSINTIISKHQLHLLLLFCLAKGEKYIEKIRQIHVTFFTNPCNNSDKPNNSSQHYSKSWSNFVLVLFGKRREIHVTTLTYPFNNFDKSMQQLIQQFNSTLARRGRVNSAQSQKEH